MGETKLFLCAGWPDGRGPCERHIMSLSLWKTWTANARAEQFRVNETDATAGSEKIITLAPPGTQVTLTGHLINGNNGVFDGAVDEALPEKFLREDNVHKQMVVIGDDYTENSESYGQYATEHVINAITPASATETISLAANWAGATYNVAANNKGNIWIQHPVAVKSYRYVIHGISLRTNAAAKYTIQSIKVGSALSAIVEWEAWLAANDRAVDFVPIEVTSNSVIRILQSTPAGFSLAVWASRERIS